MPGSGCQTGLSKPRNFWMTSFQKKYEREKVIHTARATELKLQEYTDSISVSLSTTTKCCSGFQTWCSLALNVLHRKWSILGGGKQIKQSTRQAAFHPEGQKEGWREKNQTSPWAELSANKNPWHKNDYSHRESIRSSVCIFCAKVFPASSLCRKC